MSERKRTTAKTCFTRQVIFISKGAGRMVEELWEEFDMLSDCPRKVVIANDEYRIRLLADATKVERLGEALEDDVGKTLDEAETRFKQVSRIFQTNLWSRYGHDKITAAVLVRVPNWRVIRCVCTSWRRG